MNFVQAVQTCFKKYVDFSGRAGRPEYWWFFLGQFIIMLVASMINETLGSVAALGLVLPSLAVTARRLHDIGKSGWFMLIMLIPIIGWLIVLYWMVQPTGEANLWGAGPSGAERPALPPGAV